LLYAAIESIHVDSRTYQDHWLAEADHRPPPEQLAARFHAITHSFSLLYEAADRLRAHESELTQAEANVPAGPVAESPEEFEALWSNNAALQAAKSLARTLERIDWPADLPRPAAITDADQCARAGEYDAARVAMHEQLLRRPDTVGSSADRCRRLASAGLEGEASVCCTACRPAPKRVQATSLRCRCRN
jgi:hypothetical protein